MNTQDSESKKSNRRDFMKRAGEFLGGLAVVIVAGDEVFLWADAQEPGGSESNTGSADKYDPLKHRYIYLVDITKCIGCGACVRACQRENNVPEHFNRTWIERYRVTRSGEVLIDSPDGGRNGFAPEDTGEEITKAFFVPKLCNHCTNTPCVQLCPVGASYRSPDGVILVDEKRCIGCSYCVQACPYGSRFIHPETHTASKCTLCYHRITKGMLPACVEACPVVARKFGDSKSLGDEVSEIISTHMVRVLKPELYTEPNCYYVGMSKEVR